MKHIPTLFIGIAIVLGIYSYGFIDPHLSFSSHPFYLFIQNALVHLVYRQSVTAAALYVCIIVGLFAAYGMIMQSAKTEKMKYFPRWMIWGIGILLVSYPAFSYDIYNYIATAKVTFQYRENPYVMMPIEIPNEPMLSFTRAANKVALYGPAWIVLTSFPYIVGAGNMLATIVSFKTFTALFYTAVTYLIYRKTKRWDQVMFFALNPLILIEVLVSGHNDIVMMALGLAGLLLWNRQGMQYKAAGTILFISSVLIKGATIALVPLLFFSGWKWEKKMLVAGALMFGVFLLSPLREEMYPWYAVWWLSCIAFVPIRKHSFIHWFSFWLSFGLILRYVPWIATREYGGITPVTRIIVTTVPVLIYVFIRFRKKIVRPFTLLKKYL
ncbi:MAG: hypothetical protein AAB960_00335 [Patescibacteria group bacterium]